MNNFFLFPQDDRQKKRASVFCLPKSWKRFIGGFRCCLAHHDESIHDGDIHGAAATIRMA
jgi:hypothetical protein